MVLAAVTARRRMEDRARTLDGALALVKELAAAGTGQAATQAAQQAAHAGAAWVTVPDLGALMEELVFESAAEAERGAAANRDRLAGLLPLIPVAGENYPVPEYVQRFQALCESVVLSGELGPDEETERLAQFGAGLVLGADLTTAPPWILDMGGDICWAIAVTIGDSQWYHRALERYQAAGAALAAAGYPADALREHALALVGRCAELIESAVAPRQPVIDTARAGLAVLAPHAADPDVVRLRFAVARAAADHAELAALAAPSFPGRSALSPGDLRIAQTLGGLVDHDAWRSAFGLFAAPLYAWCTGTPQADAFTAFGLLDADDDLPPAGAGHRLAQIGTVVLAESDCDEVGTTTRQWLRLAERSAQEGDQYLVEGVPGPVRRAVPAAGMIALARYARRAPGDVPDSLSFLFKLGQEHAGTPAFSQQADRMLAFFEGLDESETSETCGAVLLGAALATLPAASLGAYSMFLALGRGHLAAAGLAAQGIPITAWTGQDHPDPAEQESEG